MYTWPEFLAPSSEHDFVRLVLTPFHQTTDCYAHRFAISTEKQEQVDIFKALIRRVCGKMVDDKEIADITITDAMVRWRSLVLRCRTFQCLHDYVFGVAPY